MKTKLFTILISTALILTACSEGGTSTTYIGETRMSTSNLFSVTLTENLHNKDVTAEIELNMNNANIPAGYSSIEFYAGEKFAGTFNNGFLSFQPKEFGNIECEVVFKNSDGAVLGTLSDTGQFYLETWFVAYNSSENGDAKPAINGNLAIYPDNVAFGACDMIWIYNIRVPHGKKITLSYSASRVTDNNLKFDGDVLECHFRFIDYADRITTYGGLQSKYFDAETDKWISSPLELEHGIYDVYVCPNAGADKSRLYTYHKTDEINGSFSAMYKTTTNWPF